MTTRVFQLVFRHVPWFSFYVLLSFACFTANLINIQIERDTAPISQLQKTSADTFVTEKPTFGRYITNLSGFTPISLSERRARYRSILENRSPLKYFPWTAAVLRGLCSSVTSFWAVANMGYCLLFILGRLIQRWVFVELRQQERLLIRDRICRFLFYNILYIFILLNVQTLIGVLLWGGWFSVLGFLHLMTTVTADRFEFYTFSPRTTSQQHGKLIALLLVILISVTFLGGIAVMVGFYSSGHVLFFMLTKAGLVGCISLQLLAQYFIYLYDHRQNEVWLSRGPVKYYTNLVFDLTTLSIDFGHHLHLLVWSNIFLSVASLVVLMQLRYLFCEFIRRVYRHRNYRRLAKLMEERFPLVEVPEETCAICWVNLTSCRQLPCRHVFHEVCLRAWLEQDPSCPTCRRTLGPLVPPPSPHHAHHHQEQRGAAPRAGGEEGLGMVRGAVGGRIRGPIMPAAAEPGRRTTHFFHLDGSRYFSWLPSLHVEVSQVTGPRLLSGLHHHDDPTAAGGANHPMSVAASQVRAIFPHLPLRVIEEDLRRSGSAEATVDNIVEGRVSWEQQPHHHQGEDSDDDRDADTEAEGGRPSITTSRPTSDRADMLSTLTETSSTEVRPIDQSDQSTSSGVECGGGSRFSKSTQERESILAIRKREMIQQARHKFMQRSSSTSHQGHSGKGHEK